MTSAYDRDYLEDAMLCLGEALDYAANACQMDMNSFMDMFFATGYAERFEEGEPQIVSGISGSELVCRVLRDAGLEILFPDAIVDYGGVSNEFWVGWFLAYFQWYSNRPFKNIIKNIPLEDFMAEIPAMLDEDEADRQARLDEIAAGFDEGVRIQEMRKECGYSQKELAEKSGVNLRTLQQYEIRSKDINKAAAVTIDTLAKTMGCEPKDIMEF